MDILTHTVSGVFAGSLVGSYFDIRFSEKIKIITLGGIAGFLPDIDVISLWSGFDSSIGDFFNLDEKGSRIYSDKLWYSHHSFFHSFSVIFLYISIFLIFSKKIPYLITFFLAYSIHLFEDLPTPDHIWHGIRLFFPNETYYGGFGLIWWWNNYDIFLIITMGAILSLFSLFIKIPQQKLVINFLFLTSLILTLYQIKTREENFAYSSKDNQNILEQKSLKIQRQILGNKLFKIMRRFDNMVKISF